MYLIFFLCLISINTTPIPHVTSSEFSKDPYNLQKISAPLLNKY